MNLPRFVRYWMPAIVWMALLFLGSTDVLSAEHTSRFLVPFLRWLDPQVSFATIVAVHTFIRKLGHFSEYAILAALLWHGLRGTFLQMNARLIGLITLSGAALFAA